MDLSAITSTYSENGSPAYDPKMMVKVLFYGYTQGLRSSRRIETELYESIVYRYLSASQTPDHGTINLFRKTHLVGLKDEIFPQIVMLSGGICGADMSDISVDGTKIKANASKKNNLDAEKIAKLRKRFSDILAEAEAEDNAEDQKYGASRGYNAMPAGMADPEERKRRIKEVQAKLDQLKAAEGRIKDKQDQVTAKEEKKSKKNSTSNTTDPDANLMKLKDGSYQMAYNAQFATTDQIITAYDLNGESTDHSGLQPMIAGSEKNTGEEVKTVKADAGYFSKSNIGYCDTKEIDAYLPDPEKSTEERQERHDEVPKYDRRNFTYDGEADQFVCPEGKRMKLRNTTQSGAKRYIGTECHNCPVKEQCTKDKRRNITYDFEQEKRIKAMREKLNSAEGKKKYLERMSEIEPVIGDLKHNRGLTHFLCRGKPTALIELGLSSIAHNLVKTFQRLRKDKISRENIQWNSLMRLPAAG